MADADVDDKQRDRDAVARAFVKAMTDNANSSAKLRVSVDRLTHAVLQLDSHIGEVLGITTVARGIGGVLRGIVRR